MVFDNSLLRFVLYVFLIWSISSFSIYLCFIGIVLQAGCLVSVFTHLRVTSCLQWVYTLRDYSIMFGLITTLCFIEYHIIPYEPYSIILSDDSLHIFSDEPLDTTFESVRYTTFLLPYLELLYIACYTCSSVFFVYVATLCNIWPLSVLHTQSNMPNIHIMFHDDLLFLARYLMEHKTGMIKSVCSLVQSSSITSTRHITTVFLDIQTYFTLLWTIVRTLRKTRTYCDSIFTSVFNQTLQRSDTVSDVVLLNPTDNKADVPTVRLCVNRKTGQFNSLEVVIHDTHMVNLIKYYGTDTFLKHFDFVQTHGWKHVQKLRHIQYNMILYCPFITTFSRWSAVYMRTSLLLYSFSALLSRGCGNGALALCYEKTSGLQKQETRICPDPFSLSYNTLLESFKELGLCAWYGSKDTDICNVASYYTAKDTLTNVGLLKTLHIKTMRLVTTPSFY